MGELAPDSVLLFGVSDFGKIILPGIGVKLLELPASGELGIAGTVVLSGLVPLSGGVVPGTVVLSGLVPFSVGVAAGSVVLVGMGELSAVPPGQRELRGNRSHRIFIPSGDILISVGELVDELLDSSDIGD